MCIGVSDNELVLLEAIHLFVGILDHYFENVCELDLVFNFHKVAGDGCKPSWCTQQVRERGQWAGHGGQDRRRAACRYQLEPMAALYTAWACWGGTQQSRPVSQSQSNS
jgi:hypothetical protein